MTFDGWKETTKPATAASRCRERAVCFAGGAGAVRLCDADNRTIDAHLRSPPHGGTATATLSLQASWQTDARARRIAAIFAAHAVEICAEIDALDDLPGNARVVQDSAGFEPCDA